MDLTPVAHLAALKGKLPFINFFDGFRTSHEIQKNDAWDYGNLKDMMDMEAVRAFRRSALNPNHACQMGSAQNRMYSSRQGKQATIFITTCHPCDRGYVAGELGKKQAAFDYAKKLPVKQEAVDKFKANTVNGSQFRKPFLEFSGACAGCGETPYAKLVPQLFGDRMYIANATGCSSIWGDSYRLHSQVCGRRQGSKEERPSKHRHELRICIRGTLD